MLLGILTHLPRPAPSKCCFNYRKKITTAQFYLGLDVVQVRSCQEIYEAIPSNHSSKVWKSRISEDHTFLASTTMGVEIREVKFATPTSMPPRKSNCEERSEGSRKELGVRLRNAHEGLAPGLRGNWIPAKPPSSSSSSVSPLSRLLVAILFYGLLVFPCDVSGDSVGHGSNEGQEGTFAQDLDELRIVGGKKSREDSFSFYVHGL